jgi:hypothetical protein
MKSVIGVMPRLYTILGVLTILILAACWIKSHLEKMEKRTQENRKYENLNNSKRWILI